MMLAKTEGRPHIPRDGRHCDLCGCSQPAVRCDKCGSQIFCLSCDDMYHRHPKRRFHLRKAVDAAPPCHPQARPALPAKGGHVGDPAKMPLPPPRKKKPKFFDSFRRRSPSEEHSPPLPKKEYSWTDRFGNIKKSFMSNRPLPPLPTSNGATEEATQEGSTAKHDMSFIHKKVDEKPPQLPQRNLKPAEFTRELHDKENHPSPVVGNGVRNGRNGTLNPSHMSRNNGFEVENQWNNQAHEHQNPNTLMRQPPSGYMYPGSHGYPGTLHSTHQSATDLHSMDQQQHPGQYPQYPPMPYPYPPMYPHQYPPQFFSPPSTTDGDFSDHSEASSRHHSSSSKRYPFRKRAKRSQSVLVDRMAYPGQFFPFGPYPPGYGPWGGPYPMEGGQAPPSPAASIRSLNRIGRRRKKKTSEEDDDFSSSPLSRPKSSSSERPKMQPVESSSEEEYEKAEKERSRSRSRSRNDRVIRRDSDPKRITSPIVRSPQVSQKKFPKYKKEETLKRVEAEDLRQSPPPAKTERPTTFEDTAAGPSSSPQDEIPSARWECVHCTFLNPPGHRICQVCCKTFTAPDTSAPSGRQSSEMSCSSPEKEEEDTRKDKQDMAVLNSALDEAEKEISRGLEELMKLKEDFPPSESPQNTPSPKPPPQSLPPQSNSKPVYKSSGKMRTSLLDKLTLPPSSKQASTDTQTGTASTTDRVLEARAASTSTEDRARGTRTTSTEDHARGSRNASTEEHDRGARAASTSTERHAKEARATSTEDRARGARATSTSTEDRSREARCGSTSSTTSEAYNSPVANSPVDNQSPTKITNKGPRFGSTSSTTSEAYNSPVANSPVDNPRPTNKGPSKDTSCQTQTDDLVDYLERRKAEDEAFFGRSNGFGYRYGDRVTSPVFDRGYPVMQRSHSRASLFTGRMNDLGPLDYGLGPSPMYRSVSRSSLTGDYPDNGFSDFHNLRKPAYYLSMEELVERRRQDSIRAQGLELVRMIREAEQQGFTADDIQVALHNCGNQSPLDWLHENWRQMVDQVVRLSASYAQDKRENDVGDISEMEAREALRMHKGNLWPAVTECVESRQRKFLELKARGKFSTKDITDALSANQGDVEMAHAKLTKSSSKPFLMRIWGAGEGAQNQDIPPPSTSRISNTTMKDLEELYFKSRKTIADDVQSDETWDEEEEDVEWDEDYDEEDEEEQGDLEDLQTCHDDVVKTPDSDRSDYCDAFGSNTLERNVQLPTSEVVDEVVPGVKLARRGSFLSKLAGLKKSDKDSKQITSDVRVESPRDDASGGPAELSKFYNPISVIKNTISAIRDTVGGSKVEKKLPCSVPERRTIIVKGQIGHETNSDVGGVKLTSVKPLAEDESQLCTDIKEDTLLLNDGEKKNLNKLNKNSGSILERSRTYKDYSNDSTPASSNADDGPKSSLTEAICSSSPESKPSNMNFLKSEQNQLKQEVDSKTETISNQVTLLEKSNESLSKTVEGSSKYAEKEKSFIISNIDAKQSNLKQSKIERENNKTVDHVNKETVSSIPRLKADFLANIPLYKDLNKQQKIEKNENLENKEFQVDHQLGDKATDKKHVSLSSCKKKEENTKTVKTQSEFEKANSNAENSSESVVLEPSMEIHTQNAPEITNLDNYLQTKDNNAIDEKSHDSNILKPSMSGSKINKQEFSSTNSENTLSERMTPTDIKENNSGKSTPSNKQAKFSEIEQETNKTVSDSSNTPALLSQPDNEEISVEIDKSQPIIVKTDQNASLEGKTLSNKKDRENLVGVSNTSKQTENVSESPVTEVDAASGKVIPLTTSPSEVLTPGSLDLPLIDDEIVNNLDVVPNFENNASKFELVEPIHSSTFKKGTSINKSTEESHTVPETTSTKKLQIQLSPESYPENKTPGSDINKTNKEQLLEASKDSVHPTKIEGVSVPQVLEVTTSEESETSSLHLSEAKTSLQDKEEKSLNKASSSPVPKDIDSTVAENLSSILNSEGQKAQKARENVSDFRQIVQDTSVPSTSSMSVKTSPLSFIDTTASSEETVIIPFESEVNKTESTSDETPQSSNKEQILSSSVKNSTPHSESTLKPETKASPSSEPNLISSNQGNHLTENNLKNSATSSIYSEDAATSESLDKVIASSVTISQGPASSNNAIDSLALSSSSKDSPTVNSNDFEASASESNVSSSPVAKSKDSETTSKDFSTLNSKDSGASSIESKDHPSPDTKSKDSETTSTHHASSETTSNDSSFPIIPATDHDTNIQPQPSVAGLETTTAQDVSDEEDDSVTPPSPINALRHRFEGLVEDSSVMGPIRPASPFRRMSFRSRKEAIAIERTRDSSAEKPWFLPKPKVIETKKPLPKRSLKQQMETDRKVRKLVADRKVRTYRKAEIVVQLMDLNFEEEEAILASNECSTFELALSYLQQECLLCTGHFPVSHIISMVHCQHRACRECIRAYFTVQIRDRNIMELLCPFCNEPDISDEDIAQDYFNHLDMMLKKLVDPEIHELFQRKLRDRVLMRDPSFRWCSKCSSGFLAMENLTRLVCPDCNAVTCANCRRPWEREHQGISCEAFASMKDGTDPEAQAVSLAKLLTEDGIDCPRCHFRYALAKGGCMHFRCIQCQHDFCSGCSRPFKMGQKCGVSEFCAKLGLHAHHPRNCLFYLRDKDPEDLQRLLDLSEVKYDRDPPEEMDSKRTCQVMEQKETSDGMLDDYCGKEVEQGYAGLCRLHYVEYLGQLVNKHTVDPIQIFENDDLELVLRRANIRLPPRRYRETDDSYRVKLVDIIHEELPLDKMDGS